MLGSGGIYIGLEEGRGEGVENKLFENSVLPCNCRRPTNSHPYIQIRIDPVASEYEIAVCCEEEPMHIHSNVCNTVMDITACRTYENLFHGSQVQ
jgi:hypothetical protein